jgi:AraC-like DNA-binding protein
MSIQQDPPKLVAYHWHEHLEFIKVLRGPVEVLIDRETFIADKDDIFFINSCQMHSVMAEPGSDGAIQGMVLDKSLFFQSLENIEFNHVFAHFIGSRQIPNRFVRSHPLWSTLDREMTYAYEEYTREEFGYEYNILASIYRMITPILRLYRQNLHAGVDSTQYNDYYMRLKPAVDYMEENYASKINMKDVCRTIHTTPDYFSKLFNKVFGVPPIQHLTRIRINRAKRMLEQTETITEIAERCGFCNINYFDQVFKKQTGLSPLEFRKRYQKWG